MAAQSLSSGAYPRWVGANIVGPEQDDRGCLDLLASRLHLYRIRVLG